MFSESTILLAVIGMIGLFSTAIIWKRANSLFASDQRITSKYYNKGDLTITTITTDIQEWLDTPFINDDYITWGDYLKDVWNYDSQSNWKENVIDFIKGNY